METRSSSEWWGIRPPRWSRNLRARFVAGLGVLVLLGSACNGTQLPSMRIPAVGQPPFSLANVPFTDEDPLVDGKATNAPEWTNAAVLPDIFFAGPASRAGFYYFESRMGWQAKSVQTGAETTYPGHTLFVAHDIVGSKEPQNPLNRFQIDHLHDWNSFEFPVPSGKATIWVFDDTDESDDSGWLPAAEGLALSGLSPEGSGNNKIDDRGFIARLNDDPATDVHWFEGMPEPGDAAWDWRDWHYVFGRHHFGQSFQDVGLDTDPEDAVPHEVYEFISYNWRWDPDNPGDGAPDEDPWCLWWEWETITIKTKRRVIVIKDGSPTRATLIQEEKIDIPVLRGDFWLHFLFTDQIGLTDGMGLGQLALTQLDALLENPEIAPEQKEPLAAARDALARAYEEGIGGGDYPTLFEQLTLAYENMGHARQAGLEERLLADLEVQALSAVAAAASAKIVAIDRSGVPIEDASLGQLYGGLYDFGRAVSEMEGKNLEADLLAAAKHLQQVFERLPPAASK